ncbi:MAG: glutamine synthetase [Myxococcota bacterium]|jgi:glutamine synthetase
MNPRQVSSIEDAIKIIEERNLSFVKVGVFDVDGVLRGKYISKPKFISALKDGFGFCDVVLGWDSEDKLYDNVRFTGWHTGYPDAQVRIIPESCRELPSEETLLFLGEFMQPADAIGPRATLQRVIEKARSMGFTALSGLEFEFFVFDETPESVREKNYQNLKPIAPGTFGYSMIRTTVFSELYQDILKLSEQMDFPIEGLHEETGPGVLEAALAVDEIMAMADKGALFKTFTKVLAQKRNMMATFMAKWSPDYPGQSGHMHISLKDLDGHPVFYDPQAEDGMSETMRHFVAGCQQAMPEVLAMVSPTINSFSRMVPGAWAPTSATWGVENRTCALRVIPGSAKSQRLEYRLCAADINPYIASAAVLASGLHGIENKLELKAGIKGNAYTQPLPDAQKLPTTLWDAAQSLKGSAMARAAFGDDFVDHFAATREWEEREFRKSITDWELKRYFEII